MYKLRDRAAVTLLLSAALITVTITAIIVIHNNTENAIIDTLSPVGNTYIIDAGHGGEDGGAVASDGTVEKELNLDTALKLNDLMNLFGYSTVMTRTSDKAVGDESLSTLRERKTSDIKTRAALLENTENGILISIHQNMFSVSKYSGAQIFYSANNPESRTLAESVRLNIVNLLQPNNERMTKPSGDSIYILYHAQRPAIMVECGFLSNSQELEKLKTEDYRKQLAFSVFCGIHEYDWTSRNIATN